MVSRAAWLLAPALAGQMFEADLQPIFRRACYGCHAANVRMGSLDVETHAGLMRGGNQGRIVEPGNARESRLYRILAGTLEPAMPMGAPRLTETELAVVRAWINAGARPQATALAWRGETIAAAIGGEVLLLRPRRIRLGEMGKVVAISISPDGARVAAAGLGVVKVWDAGSAKEIASGEWEHGAIAVDNDGRISAAGPLPAFDPKVPLRVRAPGGGRIAVLSLAGELSIEEER